MDQVVHAAESDTADSADKQADEQADKQADEQQQARAAARVRAQARLVRTYRPTAGALSATNTANTATHAVRRPARRMTMDPAQLTLTELHARHARHARTLNKSEKTIDWYRGAIEDFSRFLGLAAGQSGPCLLQDFTLEAVRDYVLYLRGRPAFAGHPFLAPRAQPLADASVNCYVRALRAFASWLYDQEYTETNILGRLKAPRMTHKVVDILSDEEIACVLHQLRTPTATNARNRAIFLTLLDTGIRASELLTLTLPRAHLDEGYLLVLGKGKKERPVKIGQTAAQAIRRYLSRYRPDPARSTINEVFLTEGYRVLRTVPTTLEPQAQTESANSVDGASDIDEEAILEEVIFSEPGWPLTENALRALFTRLGRHAGVPRLHPHLLRHTYACRYLLAHRDPIALKTMLGHTTLAMTNHYVAAVESMQVIRSDRVSVVDAMDLAIGGMKRGHKRGQGGHARGTRRLQNNE